MTIEAKKVKEWCDANLSVVAWQRIVVKVSPQFRGTGLNLKNLTAPDASVVLNDEQYDIIKKAIEDTYEAQIEIRV